MKRYLPILVLAGVLALLAGPLFGQGKLKVTGVTGSGNNLTITLQNTVTIPPTGLSASFRMQSSPTLASGTWEPAGAGPFSAVSGFPGFYTTTFTKPAGTKYFFRFLGIKATAGDQDGDGLSDALEDTLYGGSAKMLFDCDGDGFSDGRNMPTAPTRKMPPTTRSSSASPPSISSSRTRRPRRARPIRCRSSSTAPTTAR